MVKIRQSFVEEPPRTPQETHHLVLQPIHGFEARADAGDLRDGKETEVMVARKHDSPPVPHPAQNQAEEYLELIGIPAVLLSVQLYQWIERSEVWLSDSVHRAWTMTNQRTKILFLSHFLEIQNNGRRDSLRLRASDSLRRWNSRVAVMFTCS